MKTKLLVLGLMILPVISYAQEVQFSWVKQIAGPSHMQTRASATDPSGAVITCGSLEGLADFNPGAGSNTGSSAGLKDAFIYKLNASGDYVWSVVFGSTADDIAYDVATDAQGNVYCTGEFRGTVNFNPLGTAVNLTAFSGYNAFVVKYSSQGQFLWVRKFGGASQGYETGRTISVDASGNVLSSGQFYGTVDFDPGAGVSDLNFNNSYGCYISKLSADGSFVWAKGFPGYYTVPNELKIDGTNHVYCVGTFYSNTDFDPGVASYTLNGQYYDTYITKLDPQGNFVWARQFQSSSTCFTSEIQIDPQGNIFAAGHFNGTTDFNPDLVATQTVTNTQSSYRSFLVKLDSQGLFQWMKQLSPNSETYAFGLKRDVNGNLFVSGHFKGVTDFNPDPVAEYPVSSTTTWYDDGYITKLDANGNFIEATTFGGSDVDQVNALLINPATGVLNVVGTFSGTCDFSPGQAVTNLTSAGLSDGFVARFVQCQPVTNEVEASACGSYDYNGNTYTSSGIYESTFTTPAGCDSIVSLVLEIFNDTFSNVQLYATDVIEYNGITYSAEGDYVQTAINSNGCDSLIYINVDILESSFTVQNNNGTLVSGQQGVSYQWVDCNNGNTPIAGATSQSFTPTQSGSYAVIVFGNDGSVTSDCFAIIIIGVEEHQSAGLRLFPNPFTDLVQISKTQSHPDVMLVLDMTGKIIERIALNASLQTISLAHLANGIYLLKLENKHEGIRVVKQ
jgi:hypothetical protein